MQFNIYIQYTYHNNHAASVFVDLIKKCSVQSSVCTMEVGVRRLL